MRVDTESLRLHAHVAAEGVVAPFVTRRTECPWRAAATATFVALPPRNFPNVRTSSSPTPCWRG